MLDINSLSIGGCQVIIQKVWPWTIVGNIFGVIHTPCTSKTSFVDFKIEQEYCSHYKTVHENSHFLFPGESKKKHMGKWNANWYFPPGKCYKSVVARCCTLWLSDISVSETGLRFILSLNSVCKGIKLYLHEIPDNNVAVCSRTYRYFEIQM